jgi:hypothetical protein
MHTCITGHCNVFLGFCYRRDSNSEREEDALQIRSASAGHVGPAYVLVDGRRPFCIRGSSRKVANTSVICMRELSCKTWESIIFRGVWFLGTNF